ncbi:MAG TPA: hypothetical protein VJ852_09510 [Gemmatimonadaceae bacterium]|nr:hypothetical protein [Gemmatimonadaceae bacterium]
MDGFFGRKPPHVSARNTAIFGMALTVLIYFVAFFQNDDTGPLWKSIRVLLPAALFFLVSFAFVAYQLRHKPDEKGLAMGVAFPATVIALFAYSVLDSYVHGASETRMALAYSFIFFFASPAWALFLWLMIPTLLRLMYKSIRASLGVTRARPHLSALAGFALLSLVGYQSSWNIVHEYDADTGPYYRTDKTAETIEPLYLCLWTVGSDDPRGRGFPDSLGGARRADGAMERGVNCGKTLDRLPDRAYTVEYKRPSKTRFTLTLVEKTRSGVPVHKVWVDQTGVTREAVEVDGRLDSVQVVNAGPLVDLLEAQRRIEDYAKKNPRHEYPAQLVAERTTDDTLAHGTMELKGYRDCTAWTDKSASCVRNSDARRLVYTPQRSPSGLIDSYTLLLPSSVRREPTPLNTRLGERFRSYLRDASGALHAYGGNRDATRADPAPMTDELATARDRVEWLNSLRPHPKRSDLNREAQWDSVRAFRRDSIRQDSLRRTWHATREVLRV